VLKKSTILIFVDHPNTIQNIKLTVKNVNKRNAIKNSQNSHHLIIDFFLFPLFPTFYSYVYKSSSSYKLRNYIIYKFKKKFSIFSTITLVATAVGLFGCSDKKSLPSSQHFANLGSNGRSPKYCTFI
jgi:hypothetical protein